MSNDIEQTLAEAFPIIDPLMAPYGARILVQLRAVKEKVSSAGIFIPQETKETEKWNTQVGKIISIGPLAFKKRESMEPWPEGAWAQVGDFVRVPKWGGDRWEIDFKDEQGAEGKCLFTFFNDHELIGKVTGDPRDIKAFI
jgi:co-chaperonin GroES (HSP10)|tara:strand:+ start:65 stop:487 length:423 start_codon:yes stop_codon:yes gene_type:complete